MNKPQIPPLMPQPEQDIWTRYDKAVVVINALQDELARLAKLAEERGIIKVNKGFGTYTIIEDRTEKKN